MVKNLRENIFLFTVTIFVTILILVPPLHFIICTCEQIETVINECYESIQFSSLSALIAPAQFQYALKRLSSALLDKVFTLTDSDGDNDRVNTRLLLSASD